MTREAKLPRHAVILAAGLGTRLRPLTEQLPKPLVEVQGVAILHNALRCLAGAGIRQATIVVGYRKETIIKSCGRVFAGVEITYCESSVFDRTGSAYSLWLARDSLQENALILEGDVFFEPAVLDQLLREEADDVAAVSSFVAGMSGSAVTLSAWGYVAGIRMNQTMADIGDEPLFKTVNIFRFCGATLREVLLPELDGLIGSGNTTAYVEQILKRIVDQGALKLKTVNCDHLKWFEIDSEIDLRQAEIIFVSPPFAASVVAGQH